MTTVIREQRQVIPPKQHGAVGDSAVLSRSKRPEKRRRSVLNSALALLHWIGGHTNNMNSARWKQTVSFQVSTHHSDTGGMLGAICLPADHMYKDTQDEEKTCDDLVKNKVL